MENEEKTVDLEDETQDEETFEVDESEEESTDDGDESNQHHEDDEAERLRTENAKLQRLLKKASKSDEEKPKEDTTSNGVTREDLERVRLEAKGFDDEQVDFLMKFGGSQATKDDAVMQVISAMKEKKAQESAQAKSSSQSKTSRRYSQEDMRNMPLDKLEKLIREGKIK